METGEELRVELPGERPKARAAAAVAGAAPSADLPAEGVDLENHVAAIERTLLQAAMRQSNGVQTRAAELLKLSYRSFRHLLKKYEL